MVTQEQWERMGRHSGATDAKALKEMINGSLHIPRNKELHECKKAYWEGYILALLDHAIIEPDDFHNLSAFIQMHSG